MGGDGPVSQLLQRAIDQGDVSRLTQLANQRLQLAPSDGRLHEEIGLAFHRINQFPKAQELLELAQIMVSLKPESELALAECYLASDNPDLALGLLENAVNRKSVSTHTLLRVASELERLSQFRTAWQTCRKAIRQSPDDAQAWFDLSFYMGRLRFPFSKIELVAQRAIELEPKNVVFRVSLASALCRLDRQTDAYQLVRRFGANELGQVECSCGIECLRAIFESADDWRGICLCNEQLVVRNLNGNSNCCDQSGD